MIRTHLTRLLLLALAACGPDVAEGQFNGYIEARYTLVASEEPGVITAIHVREGAAVKAGTLIAEIDGERLEHQTARAEAMLAAAEAHLADLGTGARPDELTIRATAVSEARAGLRLAAIALDRSKTLFADGAISKARLDADKASYDQAAARLKGAEAELRRTDLPARSGALEAAARERDAAEAELALLRERAADLELTAPADGRIERVYRRTGEVLGAGEPVFALLKDGDLILRFYAPQESLPRLMPGTRLTVQPDGTDAPHMARVSFVAGEPQFTPPIIYSREEREKLVFLIEAEIETGPALPPGLPVTIRLAP